VFCFVSIILKLVPCVFYYFYNGRNMHSYFTKFKSYYQRLHLIYLT